MDKTKNRSGLVKGEKHPKAQLTDHEVELVRSLREKGWSYGMIAHKMDTPKSTIVDICLYHTR